MHSSPLFVLSLCIPLPPANQEKVVSWASEKGGLLFARDPFISWDSDTLGVYHVKLFTWMNNARWN